MLHLAPLKPLHYCRLFIGLLQVVWLSNNQPVACGQTTYYVATAGNDLNNGTSVRTPFQSLTKVNSLTLQPGDSVLFRRGDTFRGTLLIRQSGTREKPIRFDAYGSGYKPVLAGSVPVGNWTKKEANIWQAPCPSCGPQVTGLYRNGIAQPMGRYPNPDAPNRGSLTIQAHAGTHQLTSQQTLTTDWTGGEVVARPTDWIIDRALITQQNGNALTINNPSTYSLADGWGFFIQNHPATLDQTGEWYYQPTTQRIQIYDDQGNPNEQFMTATAAGVVIDMTNVAHISIGHLRITQARTTNLSALNVSDLVLNHDDFTDSGEDGVLIQGVGHDILIENSTITNCNNSGVYIGDYQNVSFRRNTIRHIGMRPGQGKSGDGQYTALQSAATQHTQIENNVIDSVGYNGITVLNNTTIRQNRITNFCMTKSDGGGIYLWNGGQRSMYGIRVESNSIRRGVGTPGSLATDVASGAHGIFLDDCVEGVVITNNTVADCQGAGIYLNAVSRVNLVGNTCFNNSVGQLVLYNYGQQCLPRSNTLKENILIAKTPTQSAAGYISGMNDLAQFGSMAHNYYARPFNDVSTIRAVYNRTVVGDLSLAQWQSQFGQDLSSSSSPIAYDDYAVKSLSGTNHFSPSLAGTTDGWETWSLYNNGRTTWKAGSGRTGGSLTVDFPRSSGQSDSYLQAYKNIAAVAPSKSYLVQFDVTAPAGKKVTVFIRQRQSPYQDLTRRYEFLAGPIRKAYAFALTVSAREANPLLTFQTGEDEQPVRLDNIRLQEATIKPVDPDELIRLVDNPTATDSTVVLTDSYRDVKNHYYAHQLILKPFTSVILLRDSLPPVDVRLSLRAERTGLKVGEVTSVSLTLHQTSPGRPPLPGPVAWCCRLPAPLTVVPGGGLASGDSLLRGTVQRLLTDTTFVFWVKATTPGRYRMVAQVTAATYADPTSTPDSGTDDGEDDQASVTLFVGEPAVEESVDPAPVSITGPTGSGIEKGAVYPNPATQEFTLVAEADVLAIRLVDQLGRERFSLGAVAQGQPIRFGESFPTGYYLLSIQYKTGERRAIKLVKLSR